MSCGLFVVHIMIHAILYIVQTCGLILAS